MPYSITTKDGITIDNIPDNVPADAGTLKARVGQLRSQKGGGDAEPAKLPEPSASPVSAPSSGYAMGLRDPVDALAQIARRIVPEGLAEKVDQFGNFLADKGLPVARSNGVAGVDKIVSDVNKQYDQQRKDAVPQNLSSVITGQKDDPGFDWGRLAGNIVNPVNAAPGVALAKGANTLGSLALRGAAAGGMGGLLQPVTENAGDNFVGQKAGQAALGAATGGVLTPAVSRVAEKVAGGAGRLVDATRSAFRPAAPPPDINVAVNNVFQAHGVRPDEVSSAIRNSVTEQVQQALDSRSRIDPATIIRRAEFDAVGLRGDAGPTAGQVTRDPMQFSKEKNLSGINVNGENALASRFQAQNQALQNVFDTAGATQATDRVTAGQVMQDALRSTDVPVKGGVDDLYTAAKSMTGGHEAAIDGHHFTQNAYRNLDSEFLTDILPPEARGIMDKIAAGDLPLNVKNSVVIDRLFSKMQREAGSGTNKEMAIGIVRSALHDAPMAPRPAQVASATTNAADDAAAAAARTVDEGVTDVPFRDSARTPIGEAPRLEAPEQTAIAAQSDPQYSQIGREVGPATAPPTDEGQAARDAFDQARRAARSRFATIEETPALKAALDEGAPDKFVQKFILGADVRDVEAMNRVLQNSPEAQAQARAQVADYLKRAAFGENPSNDKAFAADRYLKTVTALGPQKLALFFNPEEVVRLNLAGKVASDINSIPVGAKYGTNTSGTAAAAVNAISTILDKVPGGSVLGLPLNFARREMGDYQTRKAINSALNPAAQPIAAEAAQVSPALVRALQSFGIAGGGFGGGALSGSAVGN